MRLDVSAFSGPLRKEVFERQFGALAGAWASWLPKQGWFNPDAAVGAVSLGSFAEWVVGSDLYGLCVIEVGGESGKMRYFLPLVMRRVAETPSELAQLEDRALARVGEQWALFDAFDDPAFRAAFHAQLCSAGKLEHGPFAWNAEPVVEDFASLLGPARRLVRGDDVPGSSTLVIDGKAELKVVRRLEEVPEPDLEVSAWLEDKYDRMAVSYARADWIEDGARRPFALLRRRYDDEVAARRVELDLGGVLAWMRNRGFVDEKALRERYVHQLDAFKRLGSAVGDLHAALASGAQPSDPFGLRRSDAGEARMRLHGDLRLERVLWNAGKFRFPDFNGDGRLPFAARREKRTPLEDLAKLARSIDGLVRDAVERESARGERLESAARQWADDVKGAFVLGYRRAVDKTGIYLNGTDWLESALEVVDG